mmetsp:Transcript_80046/g.208774  ORF Transcript_80046/g.208774 Transcript_80046/m.208774 type:complete len:207 (-) Transcript_80046:55-675(-)
MAGQPDVPVAAGARDACGGHVLGLGRGDVAPAPRGHQALVVAAPPRGPAARAGHLERHAAQPGPARLVLEAARRVRPLSAAGARLQFLGVGGLARTDVDGLLLVEAVPVHLPPQLERLAVAVAQLPAEDACAVRRLREVTGADGVEAAAHEEHRGPGGAPDVAAAQLHVPVCAPVGPRRQDGGQPVLLVPPRVRALAAAAATAAPA